MPDTNHDLKEGRQGIIDRFLKWVMPNGTVIRRFVAAAYLCGILSGVLVVKLIDRTDNTAKVGQQAICAVLRYGEDAVKYAKDSANVSAVARLSQMNSEMRATGVGCQKSAAAATPTPAPRATPHR